MKGEFIMKNIIVTILGLLLFSGFGSIVESIVDSGYALIIFPMILIPATFVTYKLCKE